MKIVSFNIRYDNPKDGVHCFDNRKSLIIQTINAKKPDIIGFQEVLPHVASWLKNTFYDYYFLGHGRESDFSGEQMLLAFKKNEYQVHTLNTFWLSPTPNISGSRYTIQSECPRTCIKALFENQNHQLFYVYNTHLDHISKEARQLGLDQIVQEIEKDLKKMPTVLLGDFNAFPKSFELAHLYAPLKNGLLFSDATESLGGTFHDFNQLKNPEKIDFIYISKHFTQISAERWLDKTEYTSLSDHYPVQVEIRL